MVNLCKETVKKGNGCVKIRFFSLRSFVSPEENVEAWAEVIALIPAAVCQPEGSNF